MQASKSHSYSVGMEKMNSNTDSINEPDLHKSIKLHLSLKWIDTKLSKPVVIHSNFIDVLIIIFNRFYVIHINYKDWLDWRQRLEVIFL